MGMSVGKEVAAMCRMTVAELRGDYAEVFGRRLIAAHRPDPFRCSAPPYRVEYTCEPVDPAAEGCPRCAAICRARRACRLAPSTSPVRR